jgi:two-component system NtrC family sensor kinase
VTGSPVGRKAVSLPWLAPAARAFVAAADDSVNAAVAGSDPAYVLHVLRFGQSNAPVLSPAWLGNAAALEAGAVCLARRPADPSLAETERGRTVREVGRVASALARQIATDDPDRAAAAALVAPLGWYALAATEPDAATPDRADAVGRKLARRWQLPDWVADVIANLRGDAATIEAVGADPALIDIVRAALVVAEERVATLGIVRDVPPLDLVRRARAAAVPNAPAGADTPATANPLLAKLLSVVAANRRRAGYNLVPKLEAENETLRAALDHANGRFRSALRDAKLVAMAELAAGAGHEINNPLAVISGHCQRMLAKEVDPVTRQSLGTVIRQTMRVHGILRGLMQFAKPATPHADVVAVVPLIEDVVGELSDLTADQSIRVDVVAENDEATAGADAAQVKTIVHHLVRNGLDAAGPDGWVTVTVSTDDGRLTVAVEDSGPGPTADQREHLFDPFFSGRDAGRGRGLGLSIAWRLATANGGDVRYVPTPGGPTRFELTLPTELPRTNVLSRRLAG